MKKHFFISRLLCAVYKGFCVLTSDTGCSSYIMKTSPAKTSFQMCPFSTDARPGKSQTPPDRRATPYYVESFQFQHGSMGSKLKISKVFSKILPRSQFSGLTANDMNNALLTLLWNLSMVQNGLKSMCFARGCLKKVRKISSENAGGVFARRFFDFF